MLASIPAGSALAADATRTSRDSRHGTGNSGNGSAPNCPNLRGQIVPGARHPRATATVAAQGRRRATQLEQREGQNSQRPAGKQFQGTAYHGSDGRVSHRRPASGGQVSR